MYSFFVRCIRTLGNALLYGTIFSFIIWGTVYAMAGTRMISLAGIDFVDFFTQWQGNGTAWVNASALHTSRNDTWIPFPWDNQNYIRWTTNFQYGNVNISDSLCLGWVCRNNWPQITTWWWGYYETKWWSNPSYCYWSPALNSKTGWYNCPAWFQAIRVNTSCTCDCRSERNLFLCI